MIFGGNTQNIIKVYNNKSVTSKTLKWRCKDRPNNEYMIHMKIKIKGSKGVSKSLLDYSLIWHFGNIHYSVESTR